LKARKFHATKINAISSGEFAMGKSNTKSHRRQEGQRTASGALSRSKAARQQRQAAQEMQRFEEAPQQVVWSARRRVLSEFSEPQDAAKWRARYMAPVTKAELKATGLEQAGSVLGRLQVVGDLSKEQMSAGEDYCQRYVDYAVLNGLPKLTAKTSSYSEVRGRINRPERLAAAMAAKDAHLKDQRRLATCSAGVKWAIKRACVLDEEAPLHLIREGLNALLHRPNH
jgi:hypothetical protein